MGVPQRIGALLLAGTVSAAEAAAQKKPDLPPDPEAAARLASANAIREKQLELASGKGFYLILDPSQGTLRLFLKAAVLHTWKVEGIEVGAPRIAFVSRGLPRDWEGRIWTKGALDPARELDRYELVAPPPKPDGTETLCKTGPTKDGRDSIQ